MKRQSEAKPWFAWYPVWVYTEQRYFWLRTVLRWNTGWMSQISGEPVWEYCMPLEYYEKDRT